MLNEMSLGRRIGQLSRMIPVYLVDRLAPLGISCGEVSFLAVLFAGDGVSQDALSAKLLVNKAATARAMASLEEKGFVTRGVDQQNKRRKCIMLTDKAYGIYDEFQEVLQGLTGVMSQDMTPEEHALAVKLLDRMVANLSSVVRANADGEECKR